MRITRLCCVLTVVLRLALSRLQRAIETRRRPPTPVRVAAAIEGPAAPSIRTNGLLANKDEIRLSFKVGGVIRSLAVSRRRARPQGPATRRNRADRDQRAGRAGAAGPREGAARRGARRAAVRRQGHQPRAAAGSAHADRGGRSGLELRGVQLELRRDRRAARWHGAAPARRGTRAGRAGKPVIVLGAQDRGFVVRTGLADREIVQVKLGDNAQIRLDALPGAALEGRVTEVASAADAASGMFGSRWRSSRSICRSRAAWSRSSTIMPSSASAGARVYVPISAIVEGDGRTRARVRARQRPRRAGAKSRSPSSKANASRSRAASSAGEQVITDGAQYLEDGEQVAIADAARRGRDQRDRAAARAALRDCHELPRISDPALSVHAGRVRAAGGARRHRRSGTSRARKIPTSRSRRSRSRRLSGRGAEGRRAAGGQADRGPAERARRRQEDRVAQQRRRRRRSCRSSTVRRHGEEIRRGRARGQCAASDAAAGARAARDPQDQPRPRQHRAVRAGLGGRAVSRTRGLCARPEGHAQDGRRRAHVRDLGVSGNASCASRSICRAWPSSSWRRVA